MLKVTEPREAKATTRDVANLYSVTPRCIQNWRDAGKIPFVRITARCIRYSLAEVEAALTNPKRK